MAANPLASLANLDIELTVRDVVGEVVTTADPPSTQTTPSTASGMGASVSLTLATGLYYVSVDGVGNGPWSTGYDDYGSLGAYTLSTSGCDSSVLPTPTVTDLVATATGRTVTLAATPSTSLGTLAGDMVFREGGTVVGSRPLDVALTLPWVGSGAHTYTATFRPSGVTHTSSVSLERTVAVRTPSTTGLVASVSGHDVTLDAAVATDDGAAVGTVEFHDGGTLVGTSALVGGAASLAIGTVATGDHVYRATFLPSDPSSYAGSVSAVRALTVAETLQPTLSPVPATAAVSTSTTTIRAPRKATAGTRPIMKVTVRRGASAASGTVVVTIGTRAKTLTLKAGTATLKLPKLTAGKLKIAVRYVGDATTTASTATRTIRVRA